MQEIELITRKELSEKLRVSVSTVDKMHYAGKIRAVNVSSQKNGGVRFIYADVVKDLKNSKK
jgi:predicted transcriptional regulator